MNEGKKKFCSFPWIYCEIHVSGDVFSCCPRWCNRKPIGNIFSATPDEIWNSQQAQLIRKGVLDNTFAGCNPKLCPLLASDTLPTMQEARRSHLGSLATDVIDNNLIIYSKGPLTIKLAHDSTCNLTCRSCRSKRIVADKEYMLKLNEMWTTGILPFLDNAETLVLSGDGDPFASKHYRDIIRETSHKLPHLKLGLCTNGQLLDEKAWRDCRLEGRVSWVQVSVDAARSETYSYVRRGGDFNHLMNNLTFLSRKRRLSRLKSRLNRFMMKSKLLSQIFPHYHSFALELLFVVQACNFREMHEFVELGRKLGASQVKFMLITHWDRAMDDDAYKHAKIWDESHPEHAAFIEVLQDDIFQDPIVNLGEMAPYTNVG